ncbi:tetratricopeptide repeat protein [Argonema antarcticum]|uniref:tetratricopeptide repeat protein n=1 Tax=Argonema antarcticum TaxID=2942763 RepID=UPI00201251E3|nr:CHAT domain-containing protein [Argonema antarcticum]MCL1469940.1 CHAT domain-containing protein [Argonema antarcticum A004/B2]
MTQEFHVSVTPVGENKYLVQTERVAPGVPLAEDLVVWPIEDWLSQAAQLLAILPAEASEPKGHNGILSSSQSPVGLGQQLYRGLFQGTLLNSWLTARKMARSRGELLRLRLELKDNRLAHLPWELLYSGDLENLDNVSPDCFVAISTDVAFSRCVGKSTTFRTQSELKGHHQEQLKILREISWDDADEKNQADALVKAGISSVLAISQYMPDRVASTFTDLFYENIREGDPVDVSLTLARQKLILIYGFDRFYWALPILYLHPEFDGYLMSTQQAAEFDEFEESDAQNPTALEDGDMNDFDDREDLAFISGLLGQPSKPNPTQESPKNTLTDVTLRLKVESTDKELTSVPITQRFDSVVDTDKPLILSEEIGKTTNPNRQEKIRAIDSPRNLVQIWDKVRGRDRFKANVSPLQNKTLLVWPLTFLLLTSLSLWFFRNRSFQVGLRSAHLLHEAPSTTPAPQPQAKAPSIALKGAQPQAKAPSIALKKASTSTVTAIAIKHFKQGDLAAGEQTVEVLLDRGAIEQAKAALTAVPKQQKDNPGINFLYGRLAWQSVRAGDKSYTVDDARRYWETAAGSLKSPVYYNALGFAYYAKGNLTRANQAWFEALYLTQEQQAAKMELASRETAGNFAPIPTNSVASPDALTAYAGLALVLKRSALDQPADRRSRLMNEALKLRQKVIRDDSVHFQPNTLKTNWLWTEQAIKDWRSLLQQKP